MTAKDISLRPRADITRIFLSSTCRFVGEYESQGMLLTHAFPDRLARKTFFILSFNHPPFAHGQIVVPNYTATGDVICTCLSILFGKRFDNHGRLESHGIFHVPTWPSLPELVNFQLPFNSDRARADVEVPLNIAEISRIAMLWEDNTDVNPRVVRLIHEAGSFYAKALRLAETDPQVSFLHLITCGEMLSNFFDYDQDELLSCEMRSILDEIREKLNGGEDAAKLIMENMRHVRRRFALCITNLINDHFFRAHESADEQTALKASDFEQRVKAAYDLRSKYVHSGVPFGGWISLGSDSSIEVVPGAPVIEDRELKKIIKRSPTLVGLERIMRFCLLRFMHQHGMEIDEKLD